MTRSLKEKAHVLAIKRSINQREFVILVALLMACNSIAIDIMLPALDTIAESLHIIDENSRQYIIFAYLGGLGFAQLVFGPISDCYGRRAPLLYALIFYTLGALGCIFASDFYTLLLCRFVQGIGGAGTRVLNISMIRDLYEGRRMAQVMSITLLAFLVIPIIAPATGQAIMLLGNWHYIFIFMAIAGLIIGLWAFIRLPETLYKSTPLTVSSVKNSFWTILSNRTALCYSLAFSLIMGALFGSISTSEQLFVGIYDLGPWFPAAFATAAFAQAVSAFLNARFVGQFGMRRIAHSQLLSFSTLAALWIITSTYMGGIAPLPLCMFFYMGIMFAFGSMGTNFNSLAMDPLGKVAGTASSVFGFLQITIGTGLGALIGQQFSQKSTAPLATGYLLLGLGAILLVLLAEKGRLFGQKSKPIQ
ncbi:multidrug effflux MFS transporter [Bartonella sp. DGB2]|uniref:multidrug effflux MFS transporter n=1 Tax=Bartonella sp. DGB2 TaxID=3388426 RepID=UPI00398F8F0D